MLTLHFKWTSIGSLGWIALPPCKAFILRRGWVGKYSISSWSELRIVPVAHRITHPLSLWAMNIPELLYSEIKPLTPWAWSSILIHHKSHAHPWFLHDLLLCQVATSHTIILVSHHRCPLGWLFWVLLIIISMQGLLLHLCTNLAAWTMINQQMVVKRGTTSPLIAVLAFLMPDRIDIPQVHRITAVALHLGVF